LASPLANYPLEQAINLRLLEVFAKRAGHAYRTASNGQEAVKVYERSAEQERAISSPEDDSSGNPTAHGPASPQPALPSGHHHHHHHLKKPEVILLDLNMPLMDGFEAARAIRRFEKSSGCSRATIVAVTGLGDIAAQEKAFASGMDLFLTKPVKMKEVTAVLEKLRRKDS
jgi:CheY-like chemotaxis protein